MNKTASERIYFKTYSYRGDKYSPTYDDIVNKNNESAIKPLSNERSNILYTLPIDKILVTLDTSSDGYNNSHDVFTGICVCFEGKRYLDVEQSKVVFKNLTQQQIEDYIRNKKNTELTF